MHLQTGKPAWEFEGFAGLATPVIFSFQGKSAVAIFCGDKLFARDARAGDELWSIPWETKSGVNACDPLFIDTKMYLSSRYGLGRALYAINNGEPKELWSFGAGATYSSSLYVDGDLYTLDGSLGRMNLENGERVARGLSGYSMLSIDKKLVLLSGSGELQIGKMVNDRFRGSIRAIVLDGQTWNVPAFSNGSLFIRNHEGVLVCVQIGNE